MKINHEPLFITDDVIKHYKEKDGVDIKYIATTSLRNDTVAVDVFYRADGTPHPEFGNRYFGLYTNPFDGKIYICNADMIEELDFGMIKDSKAFWHYSQARHDFHAVDNGQFAIDGGRAYTRVVGNKTTTTFRVKDGEFIEVA